MNSDFLSEGRNPRIEVSVKAGLDQRAARMPEPMSLMIRQATAADRGQIEALLVSSWGSTTVISRGVAHDAAALPAFVATREGGLVGLATYRIDGDACELVSLDTTKRHRGVGSALLAHVADHARAQGARRLWLITSNDNLDALRFYQRRGLRLVAVHRGAIDRARLLKASIPLTGTYGIPIHDELELELALQPEA